MGTRKPRRGTRLCRRWALKWREDGQLLGQCLRATKCDKLSDPDMYARLDLDLQRQFDSKYGLALWELCADYLGAGREYGETPFIPVDTFRKLMGIADVTYSSFKRLKDKVINPAVAEVNRVSDFRVTVDYQRDSRKITALKFKMRRVTLLPGAQHDQGK